jgi:hypothetical protein
MIKYVEGSSYFVYTEFLSAEKRRQHALHFKELELKYGRDGSVFFTAHSTPLSEIIENIEE